MKEVGFKKNILRGFALLFVAFLSVSVVPLAAACQVEMMDYSGPHNNTAIWTSLYLESDGTMCSQPMVMNNIEVKLYDGHNCIGKSLYTQLPFKGGLENLYVQIDPVAFNAAVQAGRDDNMDVKVIQWNREHTRYNELGENKYNNYEASPQFVSLKLKGKTLEASLAYTPCYTLKTFVKFIGYDEQGNKLLETAWKDPSFDRKGKCTEQMNIPKKISCHTIKVDMDELYVESNPFGVQAKSVGSQSVTVS